MKIVSKIDVNELEEMSVNMFGSLVKGVIDIEQNILIIDAPMHFDLEQELLSQGSKQADLWGINLHPAQLGNPEFIEFDSMINIRPRANNFSRSIEEAGIRAKITELINQLLS